MSANIKGVIFDLDGVIVSTDKYHYQAWKDLAESKGIYFDRAINNRLRGVSRLESLMIILEKSHQKFSDAEIQKMLKDKNDAYVGLLSSLTEDDILPGVMLTLSYLKAKGVKVGIGSSSKNASRILKQVKLENAFDVIVDGNHIKKSKPDPEVFTRAGQQLCVKPEDLLVVEDAKAGVEAAKRAGMKVLALNAAADCVNADYCAMDLSNMIISEIIYN